MKNIDFNNKTFSLITNSENGEVDETTIFEYEQKGDLVTANYYGGTIKYGKIIAVLKDDKLDMLYQCLTVDNELKAGKAIAHIIVTPEDKIRLKLHWHWLDDENLSGISEYLEN